MTITKTRSRALLALATSGTLLAATLVAAAPASAASATISGRVTVPSGAYLDAIAVVAWERTATFDDVTDTASLDSTGSFTLDELEAGTSYQLSVIDYSGKTGAGYYTRDKLVPAAADATLVKAGSTGITIRTRASAPATDIGIVLPADGTYPTWNPAGFYVLEPGNGRITGFVGNAGSGDARAMRAGPTASPLRGSFAALAAGEVPRMDMPTAGLVSGVDYTLAAVAVPSEATPDFEDNLYFYGGVNRSVTRSLSSAATFTGGTTKVDWHVLGATAKTAPTVTGTAKVGKTLTAKAGTFSLAGTVSYQWLRNGKAISGATASTYTLRGSDHGARVSVRTTLKPTIKGYGYGVKSSAQTAKVALGAAPKATAAPKVSGTAQVGKKLTASRGSWNLTGLTYSYRWLRDGKDITGATKSTYALTKADAGKKISVRVTAKRTGYATGTARSASTTTVK